MMYKVAIQCTNIKFESTAYNILAKLVVRKRKVVPIKVTSVEVIYFFSLQRTQEKFYRNGTYIQFFFAKLFPNIANFH